MPLLSTFGAASQQSLAGRLVTGGSALFDVQGDILYTSPGTPFAYGTGDFTIEMWFYPTSFVGNRVLWHQGAESTTTTSVNIFGRVTRTFNDRRYLTLYLNASGQSSMEIFGSSSYITTSNTATLNSWNHIALVRSVGTVRIFLNGTPTGAAALGSNFSDTSAYTPCIGRFSYGSLGFTGYISNVRVAKSAYYSTVFNPARSPFSRNSQGASNVQLLLNQLNSTRFLTDSSVNNLTITNSGTTFNNLSPYNTPYSPFAPVTTVSAIVTPSATTVNEGNTITFTVAGTNTTNGTYYYTIEQPVPDLTGADFTSGSLSGSFSITSNSGTFVLTSVKDLDTDGDSTFAVYVRSGSITGPVLGNTPEINLVDSSITPEFTVTPTTVNEGSPASFTVANVGPDGTYYWTVLNGTSADADFSATSGSFTVSGSSGGIENGTGTFSVTPIADSTTEGAQTFQVQIRTGSVGGTVLITSSAVTINDTSLTPVVVLVTSNAVNNGSTTVPAGYNFARVEAIGAGGFGYGSSIASTRGAGGGGAYAMTTGIPVTPGSTVYYTAAFSGFDSWVNVASNAPPTSTSQGCLAAAGSSSNGSVSAPGGTVAASIGTTKYKGGLGTGGTSSAGGGGAGDSGNGGDASGTTAGTGGTGVNLAGGAGGTGNNGFGNAFGGGGSYATSSGFPVGGRGAVRIVFTS